MSVINRRSVVMAGLGATAASFTQFRSTPARAAEFSFKLGVDWPSAHPSSLQAKATCDHIRELTAGRVDIQFFPNNMLGGDTDMLSQVRSGALEMMLIPTGVFSTFLPVAAINNVGFAFNTYDQVWKAMDGELGGYVRDQVGKSGLVVMDKIWDNGFRQLTTSNRAINAVGDIKGLKVRVPVSPIFTSMWAGLGASPVSANVNELYSALQTKVFDGQENALPHIQFFKLFEVQKYCAMTSHMWEGFWLIGNRKIWARLPTDLQAIVSQAFNEGAMKQRAILAAFATSLQTELKGEGMTFTTPDRAPFRDMLAQAGLYQQWKKQFGEDAWSRLEAVSGTLT